MPDNFRLTWLIVGIFCGMFLMFAHKRFPEPQYLERWEMRHILRDELDRMLHWNKDKIHFTQVSPTMLRIGPPVDENDCAGWTIANGTFEMTDENRYSVEGLDIKCHLEEPQVWTGAMCLEGSMCEEK